MNKKNPIESKIKELCKKKKVISKFFGSHMNIVRQHKVIQDLCKDYLKINSFFQGLINSLRLGYRKL